MQIILFAVGKMKKGPERELLERYVKRFNQLMSAIGITRFSIHEISESWQQKVFDRQKREGDHLIACLDPNDCLIVFDERGKNITSRQLAETLANLRQQAVKKVFISLGGADGHSDVIRNRANFIFALGSMTLTHQMARLIVVEQLYRSATILTHHPYHRD